MPWGNDVRTGQPARRAGGPAIDDCLDAGLVRWKISDHGADAVGARIAVEQVVVKVERSLAGRREIHVAACYRIAGRLGPIAKESVDGIVHALPERRRSIVAAAINPYAVTFEAVQESEGIGRSLPSS